MIDINFVKGDYLLIDNAPVHLGEEIQTELMQILSEAEVTLCRLPTYSPELNPCELVFGLMKNHLRNWRGSDKFWMEIIKSVALVDYKTMVSFYSKCILNNK